MPHPLIKPAALAVEPLAFVANPAPLLNNEFWDSAPPLRMPKFNPVIQLQRPQTDLLQSAIHRLVISDLARCAAHMACLSEGCSVEENLRETHKKASQWIDSRMPLIQWATARWLSRQRVVVPNQMADLTLRTAIAPIKPWRVCCEALLVAPRRIVSLAMALVMLWLFRTMPFGKSSKAIHAKRHSLLAPMMDDIASAYERLG